MPILLHTIVILATLAITPAATQAQDYRDEIMTEVVDRCYPATVRFKLLMAGRTGRIDATDAALAALLPKMVKSLKDEPHTQRLVDALTEIVTGKERDERKRLYAIAYVNCFVSGGESVLE